MTNEQPQMHRALANAGVELGDAVAHHRFAEGEAVLPIYSPASSDACRVARS